MDWIGIQKRFPEIINKYRYLVLLLVLGIFLMIFPGKKEEEKTEIPSVTPKTTLTLEDSLSALLSQVHGTGKVQVLLTQAKGEQILYQTDGNVTDTEERRNTVLITNAQREESGLIRQVNPPVYQGAVILCQGADNANVRLAIVEAVRCVTGLTSDRISVLKMK